MTTTALRTLRLCGRYSAADGHDKRYAWPPDISWNRSGLQPVISSL